MVFPPLNINHQTPPICLCNVHKNMLLLYTIIIPLMHFKLICIHHIIFSNKIIHHDYHVSKSIEYILFHILVKKKKNSVDLF